MAGSAAALAVALAVGSLAIVCVTSVHQRWAFWASWGLALVAMALLVLAAKVHP